MRPPHSRVSKDTADEGQEWDGSVCKSCPPPGPWGWKAGFSCPTPHGAPLMPTSALRTPTREDEQLQRGKPRLDTQKSLGGSPNSGWGTRLCPSGPATTLRVSDGREEPRARHTEIKSSEQSQIHCDLLSVGRGPQGFRAWSRTARPWHCRHLGPDTSLLWGVLCLVEPLGDLPSIVHNQSVFPLSALA